MNAKELEILKKLLKIAETQQKVLVKLAQSSDPSYFAEETPQNKFDPLRVDPSMAPVDYNKPVAAPASKTQSPSKPGTTSTVAPLPAEIAQALNRNDSTNGYRGSLLIEVNGKTLNVKYNTDYEMDDASTVKRNIEQALPGYFVTVIGESHSDWAANHQANF